MRPIKSIAEVNPVSRHASGIAGKPGLGTKLKHAIHAGLDATPMPAKMRQAIKGCAGCGKRAKAIDRAEQKVRAFLAGKPEMQPPPAPPVV
jgi:hypothetical protein